LISCTNFAWNISNFNKYCRSSCKVPVILVQIYSNLNLVDNILKNILKYQISWKSGSAGAELFHLIEWTDGRAGGRTDRQTDRHDEGNRLFRNFFERAKKWRCQIFLKDVTRSRNYADRRHGIS
jgi:hypothetical protein